VAISTYSELQDAVANWLDRDDLDARIPEFITLAEARMGRELRKAVTVAPLTIESGAQQISLPDDCVELRSIRHAGSSYATHLHITTPYGLDQYREGASCVPVACAVVNNTLLLHDAANGEYAMEIIYYTAIEALSDSNTTNAELTAAPDLYLFGALCEAAPFLEHDARVPLWDAKYQAALRGVNAAREASELGAGPATMSLPVVFG
jgi:hypothetical protein